MKYLKILILIILFALPGTSFAQEAAGYCTYPGGAKVSGYTKAQCDQAAGSWTAYSSNEDFGAGNLGQPAGYCTYPTGAKVSGYTKGQCDQVSGTWAAYSANESFGGAHLTPTGGSSSSSSTSTTSTTSTRNIRSENTGLVPCVDNCGFVDLITLINKVIEFILYKLALPVAAIMFAYAGFKMVTAGGNTEGINTAKTVFKNTAIGLMLAAGAWLIVKTLLSILGYTGTTWLG